MAMYEKVFKIRSLTWRGVKNDKLKINHHISITYENKNLGT